ncbi:glycoside hydrolase family 20 zincin-like fold domain-containing protein, partial [Planctomycetota bacterium]
MAERDGQVYQDEAQEFFFSAENDNDRKIQFMVNAKGVVFDYVREYDLAAVGMRNKLDSDVPHDKAMRYDGKAWTTELAFPLRALKIDLRRRRFAGFQAAQTYHNRDGKRLRTVVWDATAKFPDPTKFGVLVFNGKPFGPGRMDVLGIRRSDVAAEEALFAFSCSLHGFASGTYRARLALVGGGVETARVEEVVVKSGEPMRRTFSLRAPNRNGLYALYVELVNPRGDARLHAVNFDNPKRTGDLFGRRLLSPEPKRIAWGDGAFAARRSTGLLVPSDASERTRTTARLFADTFHGCTGRRLRPQSLAGEAAGGSVLLRVAPSADVGGREEKLKPGGYGLTVEPERVVITGADEPGLFYGTVTFFQLLRGPMRITEDMAVPCVEILDWPDTPNRLARLEHTHHFRDRPIRDNWGIAYLMDWTDRFVAGNKLNVLFIDLSAVVRHKRRPEFNGSERIYSLDDLRRFGQFCRDRFVDLCPAWQIGGHGTWWLLVGYHPELREQGWQSQADVTHPDHDPIMFDCMQDVIDALQPKYLSPKSDEWWHKRRPDEEPDELLRGKTRAQAFLDLHVKLHGWLKARGITMLVFHDMLTPYHNGKRYDLYRIIDRFPKDAVIQLWSGRDAEKDLRWFTDRGFRVWTNGTGFVPLTARTRGLVSGYGKGLYSFGGYRGGLLDRFSHLQSMASLIYSADYGWNLSQREGESPDHARLTALRHLFAVRPNPHAGAKVKPLDIAPHLTHSFGAFLKEVEPKAYAGRAKPVALPGGLCEVGFLPTRIGPDDDKNCIVLR